MITANQPCSVGRGGLIDNDALIQALESKHLRGAALDVFDPEPAPAGHKLWSMDNCIITPHIAAMTENYMARSVEMACMNAERLRKGENLLNVVDFARGY